MGTTAPPTVVQQLGSALGERHRELALLVVLLSCTFAMIALLGYDSADPTWIHPGAGEVGNPCGPLGALIADALFTTVGHGAWVMFACMVGAMLSLAGRPLSASDRAVAAVGLYLVALPLLDLALAPSEAFAPGGVFGGWLAGLLRAAIGTVGSWLALLGSALVFVTVLGRIRWGALLARGVHALEAAAPIVGGHLGQASARVREAAASAGRAGAAAAWARVLRTGRRGRHTVVRMARSLTRQDGDLEPEEEWAGSTVAGDPEAAESYLPPSAVEHTAVGSPSALAEVRWEDTSGGERASAAPSELLDLFPQLTPRPSTACEPGSAASGGIDRDAPTRPSEATPVAAPPRSSVAVSDPGPGPGPAPAQEPAPVVEAAPRSSGPGAQVHASKFLQEKVSDDGGAVGKPRKKSEFHLPRLSMLDVVPVQQAVFDSEGLRVLAQTVEETLASFKVTGEVTDVRVGPVVTTFEFLPTAGISVRKVSGLADDLAMSLCALSVRIVAPIPGKGVVGIEIPSATRMTIYLRELLASETFRKNDKALPVVLGKDVEGRPIIGDLAKMPHLLVGGTTGSGKSVGVNGMLMSLLYTRTPDELRLLLVDPKKLEFKIYEDIPHLLHPVVTEPKHAASALAWACREMDARYELLARWDTRNIASYNDKVDRELKDWTGAKARQYAPKDWPDHKPPPPPEKLPYIVIVIDELADLMLVAKKEVEGSIARLTQMARACGIHLVVATQRPSVDVVTGLIKSNLPTRVSFKLRSVIDSRTILDMGGAETLLGRGDMLYLPNTGDALRCHGPFVSDDEVGRVVSFLREQAAPAYIDGVTVDPAEAEGVADEERDALFDDAVQVVLQAGKASTSMIQRHLKIGYNRAARIIDQMEACGIVGPADGARPREVLGV